MALKILCLSFFVCLLNIPTIYASARAGFLLQTSLNFLNQDRNIVVSKEVFVEKNAWFTVKNQQHNVALLGKVVDQKEDKILVNYIVLDLQKEKNSVVSTPSILAQIGKQAKIVIRDKYPQQQRIAIKLLATHSQQ